MTELFTLFPQADRFLHRELPKVQDANPGVDKYTISREYIIEFARERCTRDVRRAVLGAWLGIVMDEEDEDEAAGASDAPAPGR